MTTFIVVYYQYYSKTNRVVHAWSIYTVSDEQYIACNAQTVNIGVYNPLHADVVADNITIKLFHWKSHWEFLWH